MDDPFLLDASQLATYQRCRRNWLLERDWRFLKWHPKSLADHCLREGVFRLSSGESVEATVVEVTARYLTLAANPGLDLAMGGDPYQVARDWCAALSTILTGISRLTLLSLSRVPYQPLAEDQSWLPLSFADESGILHRWITVDAWDSDAQARAVHSWLTVADMAVMDAGMQLHVIVVGRMKDGRRQSPWCRAYKHPVIAGRLRFQRPDGKGGWRSLNGDQWKPVWLADMHGQDVSQWVDLMTADGLMPRLQSHPTIAALSAESRRLVLAQIRQEATEMRRLLAANQSWESVPMNRGACDGWRPCPHQGGACYRPAGASLDLAESGLYQLRPAAEPSARSSIHPVVASV